MRTRTKGQLYITDGTNSNYALVEERFKYGAWQTVRQWYPLSRSGLIDDYQVCRDELHPGPPYTTGGPLNIWRTSATYKPLVGSGIRTCTVGSYPYRLRGGFSFLNNFSGEAVPQSITDDINRGAHVQSTYGTKAWNKFRPAKPEAGASQFIAELRDLPRMLKTTASTFYKKWRNIGGKRELRSTPRSVANHWLNTQFGWLPFVKDISDFVHVVKNLSSKIDQLKRDNGQWILREGLVTVDSNNILVASSPTTTHHYPDAIGSNWLNPDRSGSFQLNFDWVTFVRFTARFRYWMPNLTKPNWQGYAGRRLLGLEITPSLIWELTPWSWLIDWFTQFGDSLQLAESIGQDSLCAKYCYLMETRKQEYKCFSFLNLKQSPNWAEFSLRRSQKIRTSASPFGFGLEPVDFSARQWSILGALGLTRLR